MSLFEVTGSVTGTANAVFEHAGRHSIGCARRARKNLSLSEDADELLARAAAAAAADGGGGKKKKVDIPVDIDADNGMRLLCLPACLPASLPVDVYDT